jgi:hypothetical protein
VIIASLLDPCVLLNTGIFIEGNLVMERDRVSNRWKYDLFEDLIVIVALLIKELAGLEILGFIIFL